MTNSLFRSEALKARADQSGKIGSTGPGMPLSWRYITGLVAVFICSFFIFLSFVELSRKETAGGVLRYNGAQADITAMKAGIVRTCFNSVGSLVKKGEVVAQIKTETFLEAGASLSGEELAASDEELRALTTQLENLQIKVSVDKNLIRSEISAAQQAIVGEEAKLEALQNRKILAQKRANESAQFLAEGLMTEAQHHDRIEALENITQMILDSETQINSSKSFIVSSEIKIKQTEVNFIEESAILSQRLAQTRAIASRNLANQAYALTSPITGIISSSLCREGEPVSALDTLMTVIESDTTLIAEVYLPTSAIALVEEGQEVTIRYEALPYQKFGVFSGKIDEISRTTLKGRSYANADTQTDPSYLVIITLEDQFAQIGSKKVQLQSGMLLEADIILENRPAISWIVEPIFGR